MKDWVLLVSVFLLGAVCVLGVQYFMFPLAITGHATASPSDNIDEKDILVYEDRVIIRVANASVSEYASTGSMLPFFDAHANGIRIIPKSADEVRVGDIVSVRQDERVVIHRIIEKGLDEMGVYFIAQGDASLIDDGKVRFNDIAYKLIGIIY